MITNEANATLIFEIKSGSPNTFNQWTGEPEFSTSTIKVPCSLEEQSPPGESEMQGIDKQTIYLTGRVVQGETLPPQARPGTECKITWQGGDESTYEGVFVLKPVTKSRLGLDSFFGVPIAGYFTSSELKTNS